MGGFAAEFRGFRVTQGRGEAIQRTADGAELTGRKIFKNFYKRGRKTQKLRVREVLEGGAGAPYIGRAERFLGLEVRPES